MYNLRAWHGWKCSIIVSFRKPCWSRIEIPERQSSVKTAQTAITSIVSPEYPLLLQHGRPVLGGGRLDRRLGRFQRQLHRRHTRLPRRLYLQRRRASLPDRPLRPVGRRRRGGHDGRFHVNSAGQILTIDRYQEGQLAVEADYSYNDAGQLIGLIYHQGTTVLNSYAWTYSGDSSSPLPPGATNLRSVPEGEGASGWLPTGGLMPVTDTSGIVDALTSGGLAGLDLVTSCTSADGTATYSYDPLGQLTGATYSPNPQIPESPNPSPESYKYDANGNPANSGDVIGPNNELLSDGTYNYTYDAAGNLITQTSIAYGSVTAYGWDAQNRLAEVEQFANGAAYASGTPTQVVDYLYDAEGRWIGENILNGSGAVDEQERFVYDGNQIVLEFDKASSGTVAASDLSHRYLWGPAVDQILADEQIATAGQAGNVVLPLTDNQGTVRDLAVVNSGVTTVVNHRIFTAFGQMLSQTNPTTTPPTAASVDCLFGYTGLPFDTASGFNMSLTRPYSPATGRWAKRDDSDLTAGPDPYQYCGNSPTNATDPTGLDDVRWNAADVQAILNRLSPEAGKFWKQSNGTIVSAPTRSRLYPGRWFRWGSQLPSSPWRAKYSRVRVPGNGRRRFLCQTIGTPFRWRSISFLNCAPIQNSISTSYRSFVHEVANGQGVPEYNQANNDRINGMLRSAANIAEAYVKGLAALTPGGCLVLSVEEFHEGNYLAAASACFPLSRLGRSPG